MLIRYKRKIHPRRFSLNEDIFSPTNNLAMKVQRPQKDRKILFLKAVCDLFLFALFRYRLYLDNVHCCK